MTKTKQRALWRNVKKYASAVWHVPGVQNAVAQAVIQAGVRAGVSGTAIALIYEAIKAALSA